MTTVVLALKDQILKNMSAPVLLEGDEADLPTIELLKQEVARTIEDFIYDVPTDLSSIKVHIEALAAALRDEDGRSKTRELSLAVTKLQEAEMWITEHQWRAGRRLLRQGGKELK